MWSRLIVASLVVGLGIGATVPFIGGVVAHQFDRAGDSLFWTTILISTLFVVGAATAAQVWLLPKPSKSPFDYFAMAALPERCLIYVWMIAVAALSGLASNALERLVMADHVGSPQSEPLIAPAMVIIVFTLIVDSLVAWLRRASS